uniref:Uncharacterized protein n=1 Tax=Avena sativa TaxID=4498 RepID=A0ACD5UGB6_AVESA
MHSFGTPSADPIVDAFLDEGLPIDPFFDEATNARIASLQNEVDQLEINNARDEKRKQISLQQLKNIQDEKPGMIANYVISKEQDLNLEHLSKLFNELMRVQEDITHHLSPVNHGQEPNTDGPNISQIRMPLVGPSLDKVHSTSQFLSSHYIPPQVYPPIQVPSTQNQTWGPHFPIHVPQIFQPAPPHQVQELSPPLQPHL